ncbi:MAG: hypothetical protein D3922_07930 [Candidatus Electrothrix sp. AR1]|nr:hypothetical protein [Candidatus Electrothrix sp. AR1]
MVCRNKPVRSSIACGYEYPQVLRRRLPTTELRAEKSTEVVRGTQEISVFHLTLLIIDVLYYFVVETHQLGRVIYFGKAKNSVP